MQKKIKIIHLKGVGNADILACSINGTSPHLCGKKRACHPTTETYSFRIAADKAQMIKAGFVYKIHLLCFSCTTGCGVGIPDIRCDLGIPEVTYVDINGSDFKIIQSRYSIPWILKAQELTHVICYEPRFTFLHKCAYRTSGYILYVLQTGRNFAGKILIRVHIDKNCDIKEKPSVGVHSTYAGRMQPIVSARPP